MAGLSFDDIAASVSSSMSEATTGLFQNKFGDMFLNVGSGSSNTSKHDTQSADPTTASDAKATSATAKADNGGYADATSTLKAEGGALSAGIPQWAVYAALGLGAAALIALIVMTARKKPKPKLKRGK